MKQSRWARKYVKCPFYRGDGEETVSCEGPFDDVGVTLKFRGPKKQKRHMEVFCAEHFTKCEVFRMVHEAKYDE